MNDRPQGVAVENLYQKGYDVYAAVDRYANYKHPWYVHRSLSQARRHHIVILTRKGFHSDFLSTHQTVLSKETTQ